MWGGAASGDKDFGMRSGVVYADGGITAPDCAPTSSTLCGDISRLGAVVFNALELVAIERPYGPMP